MVREGLILLVFLLVLALTFQMGAASARGEFLSKVDVQQLGGEGTGMGSGGEGTGMGGVRGLGWGEVFKKMGGMEKGGHC